MPEALGCLRDKYHVILHVQDGLGAKSKSCGSILFQDGGGVIAKGKEVVPLSGQDREQALRVRQERYANKKPAHEDYHDFAIRLGRSGPSKD